jgi:CRP-like cAMP-binding protein
MPPIEFQVDKSPLDRLSAQAKTDERLTFFRDLQLTGPQRLLYKLWASQSLPTVVFRPEQTIQHSDEVPHSAYVVVSGQVAVTDRDRQFLLGSGAVIGLAEGLCEIKSRHSYRAITVVNCKEIPLDTAARELSRVNSGLKGVFRLTLQKILADRAEIPPWLA